MARQTIVMKVHMRCEKCRTKALKIAVGAYGVTGVRLEGEDREILKVEGQRVEVDELAKTLKKKVGYTQILFVSTI